jgi:pimeloyl-[acyl-carrier protein] methyl ester esterase
VIELVFIHGWGFDASFWDPLAALFASYPQRRIDLGFFGEQNSALPEGNEKILIGHSLGFIHGLRQKQNWAGWAAINGFARFVEAPGKTGCVPAAALRDMRLRFSSDPAKTLKDFYSFIGARAPQTVSLDADRLREGLDELRGEDVSGIVSALDVPGLVLASRSDPLVPVAASEALAKKTRQAKLKWHERGSHVLPQSDPAWCAQAIKEFLAYFSNT